MNGPPPIDGPGPMNMAPVMKNGPPSSRSGPSSYAANSGPISGPPTGYPTPQPHEAVVERKLVWEEDVDPDSGDPYWYNVVTGESTWERPQDMYEDGFAADNGDFEMDQDQDWGAGAQTQVYTSATASAGRQAEDAGIQIIRRKKKEIDPNLVQRKSWAPDLVEKTAAEVQQYNLFSYATAHLCVPKKKLFGAEKTLMDVLSWSSSALSKPLLLALQDSKAMTSVAIRISKDITAYTGDRKGKLPPGEFQYASELVKKGIEGDDNVRDEIYVQLIRHMTNNPSSDKKGESLERAVELLVLCVSSFPCSQTLLPYLEVFLQRQVNSGQGKKLETMVEFSRKTLAETQSVGPRSYPPSAKELESTGEGRDLMIRIGLLDGTYKTTKVRPQECAAEVAEGIAAKMALQLPKFDDQSCFGLYQVARDKHGNFVSESALEDNIRLTDVMAVQQQARDNNPESTLEFCIVYKARLFIRNVLEEIDNNSLHLYYVQALYDVSHGICPVAELQAHLLAGIAIQVEYGAKEANLQEIADKLENYLPPRFTEDKVIDRFGLKKEKVEEANRLRLILAATALEQRTLYREWDVHDCKYQFIHVLSKVPLYGIRTFQAAHVADAAHEDWDYKANQLKPIDKQHAKNLKKMGKTRNNVAKPVPCLIAVNETGVFMLEKKSMMMVRMDKMGQISSQGASGQTFVFVSINPQFGSDGKRAMVFSTPHAKTVLTLVRLYKKVAQQGGKQAGGYDY